MKQGRTLEALAEVLQEFKDPTKRRDFITPRHKMYPVMEAIHNPTAKMQGRVNLAIDQVGVFNINPVAHEQIADKLKIPKPYYDRLMNEHPRLLSQSIDELLRENPDEVQMVRTFNGTVRAVAGKGFRPLDNVDLAEATLPHIMRAGLTIESCELTDRRMYIKGIQKNMVKAVRVGDEYAWGICVTGSDVGCGAIDISGFSMKLSCLNGMKVTQGFRKVHLGRRHEAEGVSEYITDAAKAAEDKAFWLKARDVTNYILSEKAFDAFIGTAKRAAGMQVVKVESVMEVTQERYGISDKGKDSILNYLVQGKQSDLLGLSNAITRYSQDLDDYDRATELEAVGGRLIELQDSEWETFNNGVQKPRRRK